MVLRMNEKFYVYVIGLKASFAKTKAAKSQNPEFTPKKNKRCYYVGYSSKTPEERYEQHISGFINKKGYKLFSPKVHKYGFKRNGLRPRQYKNRSSPNPLYHLPLSPNRPFHLRLHPKFCRFY